VYSFSYPIVVLDKDGSRIGAFGRASVDYRPPPSVPSGTFAGSGSADRVEAWLGSFDVVAGLAVIADSLLVLTHGVLERSRGSGRVTTVHKTLDIYELSSQRKVAEDIRLPPGARVLAGGSNGLYVLVGGPPDPWTVALFVPSFQ
jgi:hypothetical protein